MDIRDRIESRFESFGYFIFRRRWVIIALTLGFAVSLSSQAPNVIIDTSTESFLRDGAPAKELYDEFRDQFGRGEVLIMAIEGPDVLAPNFLGRLGELHEALEDQVPYLEEVRSLINARVTRGEADELIVEDLLEDWPEKPEEWETLRNYVTGNPLYENLLVSRDGRLAIVSIETVAYSLGDEFNYEEGFADDLVDEQADFLSGAENTEVVAAVRELARRFDTEGFRVQVSGQPALQSDLAEAIQTNMARFVALMILIIALLLFVLFRRISGVILPLAVVLPSVSGTIGSMAIAGEFLSAPTQVLPSLLLAVGIGAAVHILSIFYQHLDRGIQREEAIALSLKHTGLPICMTSLTTAGGLCSFISAEIAPVMAIGIFAPIGILLALIYCLILLPALLAALPIRPRKTQENRTQVGQEADWIGDILVATGDFSIRHAKVAVSLTLVVVAISLLGASQIRFGHDIMKWLPESHSFRLATQLFDEQMNGSMLIEILADSGVENGVQSVEFMTALDSVEAELAELPPMEGVKMGKAISIATITKEISQALNENDPMHYAIPQNRELIAQELLLFENSGTDDLEPLVDSLFSMARVSIRVPYVDPIEYQPYITSTQALFQERLGPEIRVSTTGFVPIMSATIRGVISSMTRSYILALLIITPLMILLIGSLRTGIVSMIPNLAPIIITLGIMGWTGIVMDVFTLMLGGIAIGLAVDDTIHYMYNFRRSFLKGGDIQAANRETLRTTGRALFVTSVVLSFGFFIFIFAEMNNLYYFGLLTGITIANAFLIDILVSPALMSLAYRNQSVSPAGR
ncbi:MAG: MMPL family transporter [Myxococcota bacterium]|nr:MMPL family transporter [Myxococcota bacterium]